MDDTNIVVTTEEVNSTIAIAKAMIQPPTQFVRLFRLFTPKEQLSVLNYMLENSRLLNDGEYSLEQFVAFSILGQQGSIYELENTHLEELKDHNYDISDPSLLKLSWLNPHQQSYVRTIINGSNTLGLARVFSNQIMMDEPFIPSLHDELIQIIRECIDRPIHSPGLAAAVSECLKFNSKLLDVISHEASAIADYALAMLPEKDFVLTPQLNKLRDNISELMEIAKVDLPEQSAFNHTLREGLALVERFRLVESDYGLLIPQNFMPILTKQFKELVSSVSQDKATLLSLSPRQFEEFMADLFRSMNYEVELTKVTRDGGVDLLCLKNLNGIPFRMAIELKRYKESRPITVELVRSFVGANVQHNANKLLFVTTSSYTQPAIDFAEKYAKHLVSLKDYNQICEWCTEAGKDQWQLFSGPYLLRPNKSINPTARSVIF